MQQSTWNIVYELGEAQAKAAVPVSCNTTLSSKHLKNQMERRRVRERLEWKNDSMVYDFANIDQYQDLIYKIGGKIQIWATPPV